MKRFVAAAGVVCLALLGQPAARQAVPQTPQFRAAVDLVHLDVSVLDRDRRPVRGLTPADFTILENGIPQRISVFSAVELDPPAPPSAEWMREVAPDVSTNERIEERRLFLLIIDDAMIQFDVEAIANTKKVARQVIDRLGASDLAAVVFTLNNRNSQDYTSDRARLLAAVDKFGPGFRDMSQVAPDDLYSTYSADVVRRAVEMLATLPDRRKSIFYVGQGQPVDLDLIATPQTPGLPAAGGASALSQQGQAVRIRTLMERTFAAARQGNVNIYPVDVCGLRVEKMRAPVTPGGLPPPPPTCQPGLELDYLLTLAENTAARAVVNTNDFEPGIDAIFSENASYYLLGYQPAGAVDDGNFKRLEVRVNRPGVEIRTRSGYRPERARDAARRKAEMAKAPLGAALAGVLPVSGIPLHVQAAVFPRAPRSESAVAVILRVQQPIRPSEQRTIEKVDLQVSAYNVDGKFFGSRRMQADVAVRAGATGLADYEVMTSIELKPGRYQLRMAAHVGSLNTSGSVYADVVVPDVAKAPVTLSSAVLTASPAPASAPPHAFRDFLPVTPTARRTFSAQDRVSAFTRVYQRARGLPASIPLRIELKDQRGAAVFERRLDVAGAHFAKDRSADVNVDLPIRDLAEGEYLLVVSAGTGDDVARSPIRFRVSR